MFQPRTLSEALTLARRKEIELEAAKRSRTKQYWALASPSRSNSLSNPRKSPNYKPPLENKVNQDGSLPIKDCSPAEMESKHKQGMCYIVMFSSRLDTNVDLNSYIYLLGKKKNLI